MKYAIALLLPILLTQISCAQLMILENPGPLDRSMVIEGGERARILGMLGTPVATEEHPTADRMTDTYAFTDGGELNSLPGKVGRIALYTMGDFLTFFLTQLIWIPTELLLSGTDYTAVVDYERRRSDQRWVATRVNEFKRNRR